VDIDRTAPATAEGEIQVAAPIDTVWAVLADLSAWPTWNDDVKSMAVEGPLEPGSVFSTLATVDPPREIGWTGVSMGIHAVHVFHLESAGGGTRVRSAESFRGFIPSVLKGYSRKILQRGIDAILGSLKTEAERRGPVA